jgi:hypothetical protein
MCCNVGWALEELTFHRLKPIAPLLDVQYHQGEKEEEKKRRGKKDFFLNVGPLSRCSGRGLKCACRMGRRPFFLFLATLVTYAKQAKLQTSQD